MYVVLSNGVGVTAPLTILTGHIVAWWYWNDRHAGADQRFHCYQRKSDF